MSGDFGPAVSNGWTLPPYRHLPGHTAKPEDGPAHAMARAAPARMEPSHWQTNRAYLYGFVLYRAAYYWEAHEVWEAVWRSCRPNSRERYLLQALIQLANAGLKQRQPSAVRRIRLHAVELLREAGSADASERQVLGVDTDRLRAQVELELGE